MSDDRTLSDLMRAALEPDPEKVPRAIVERLTEPEPEPTALDLIHEHINNRKTQRSL